MKLLSMVDFIKSVESKPAQDHLKLKSIIDYANLMDRPLTMNLFIPYCEKDKRPYLEPTSKNITLLSHLTENILFEGFSFLPEMWTDEKEIYLKTNASASFELIFNPEDEMFYQSNGEAILLRNISDLVDYFFHMGTDLHLKEGISMSELTKIVHNN